MQSRPTLGALLNEQRRAEQLQTSAERIASMKATPIEEIPVGAYTEPAEEPVDEHSGVSPVGDVQVSHFDAPRRRSSFSAAELMTMEFPEPRWAIPGIVPEGLGLLAGPPKAGKSWLAYNAALAIAQGGKAFGKIPVEAGDVLYLSLEDPPRRLQQRLRIMLAGQPAPRRLTLATECAPLPGGIERIERWLASVEHPRLVIVDVFAKVRPVIPDKGNQYLADYASVSPLKALADENGVAVLVLHHVRKMGAEDFVDTISGTNGLAGAADTIAVLKRARNAADAILQITGRDVNEAEHALKFNATIGTWQLLDGLASDYELGDTRRAVLSLIREREGLGPKAVADALGIDYELAKKTMQRMVPDQLDTDGQGHYFPVSPVPPVPLSPSRDRGDAGDTPSGGPEDSGGDSGDTRDTLPGVPGAA